MSVYSQAVHSPWAFAASRSDASGYVEQKKGRVTDSSPPRLSRFDDSLVPPVLHNRIAHHEPDWDLPPIREDDAMAFPEDVTPSAPPIPPQPQPSTSGSLPNRQRLLTRLDFYGLVERVVKGDGNCQFRALSDQLYGSPSYYREVRSVAMQQLQRNPGRYQDFLESKLGTYIDNMSKPGAWGDHITLQAIADYFGVKIYVVTSFVDRCVLSVRPQRTKTSRVLWLSFWAEVHYNSLYPESEPPRENQREKVLGSKRIARLLHEDWAPLLGTAPGVGR